jgi:hypothetical protein
LLSRDPYGEGWALLIEPENLDQSLKALLYGAKAEVWNQDEYQKLYQVTNEAACGLPAGTGVTLPDGGLEKVDFKLVLDAEQNLRLVSAFFPVSQGTGDNGSSAILKQKRR